MKKILLIGVFFLAVLVPIYFYFQADSSTEQKVFDQANDLKNDVSILASSSASSGSFDIKVQDQPLTSEEKPRWDSGGITGTPAEAEVVRKWQQERGYLDKNKQKEYKRFDISTLKIMVDNGDLFAQTEVISRSSGEALTREIYKALAMGSTSAITQLGLNYIEQYEESNESNDVRQMFIIEAFAVHEMGALRGDAYSQIVIQNEFINRLKIQLTEEDKKAIQQRGKELYNEIQQQRFELGLDEFDNTVPPQVNNYYNNLYKLTYKGALKN